MKAVASFSVILAVILIPAALATDVTLWQMAECTSSPKAIVSGLSYEVSLVAVQTDGQTIYVVKEAIILVVVRTGGFTSTLIPTPTTNTFAYRADASRYRVAFQTQIGEVRAEKSDDCILRDDGSLVCSVKVIGESGALKTTIAATTTGSPRPLYTISDVESLNLPTQASSVNASSITSPLFRTLVGIGMAMRVLLV
ncbi:hypothetical protein EST38_g12856 [Candolleomyces aberdarensis]|uniref:Uncharacterized protein n=1 Tax=Candolleomyces aberdarensis TaxID=2316362 RepID=A0A4V1Q1W4_9AGAR|nr:hypothetical protein EST38_g12856 [Candolleomyces aberdarensis]